MSIFHLKGAIEVLLERLGIKEFAFVRQTGQVFSLKINNTKIGFLAEAEQKALAAFDIKNRPVFLAELNLDTLKDFIHLKKRFRQLPVYPAIVRDLSIVVKKEVELADIFAALKEKSLPYLTEVRVTDVYSGKHIPEGWRGLTLSCTYQSEERTLEDEEINSIHNKTAQVLKERFSAQLR